ncbi:unnamed protein product, partial [Chrysoparadoxa australica]
MFSPRVLATLSLCLGVVCGFSPLSCPHPARMPPLAAADQQEAAPPSFSKWKSFWLEKRMGSPDRALERSTEEEDSPKRGLPARLANVVPGWRKGSNSEVAVESTTNAGTAATTQEEARAAPTVIEAVTSSSSADEEAATASSTSSTAKLQLTDRGIGDKDWAWKCYEAADNDLDKALALTSWLRSCTSGCGLKYDGTTIDTPENKKLWSKYAPEALKLLPDEEGCMDNPTQLQLFCENIMYTVSAQGIARAALGGDAVTYKRAAVALATKYPTWDGAIGSVYLGGYYCSAPWPLKKEEKGKGFFLKAIKKFGSSKRNLYYGAVASYMLNEKEEAARLFQLS